MRSLISGPWVWFCMSAVQGLTHLMLSHRQAPLTNAAHIAVISSVEMSLNKLVTVKPRYA